ncbi:hypothetical protein KR50_11020 [Jeotgalibacillus campisalis]|uniref:Uncharacterized protein n=1 Tax=Jeotgalibacillus campisalis TaxID=220754 RepID=A0A0C2VJM2_9BACL|nr:hypothetical protein KR50_11020 [Jeotgalibacillus campisalis]
MGMLIGGASVPDWFYILAVVVLICFVILVYWFTDPKEK